MSDLNVASMITIEIPDPEEFAELERVFKKSVEKNDKNMGIKSRYAQVIISAHGQTREFTLVELLGKLGFNVETPLQKD